MVMADLKSMQVRTLVDETDMGDIRPGMQANVTVEAYPERRFVGIVEKIEPQALVQQNVTMFPVIVRLDNSSGLLRPGMNAEVEIELAQATGVLLIPNNAVVTPEDAQPGGDGARARHRCHRHAEPLCRVEWWGQPWCGVPGAKVVDRVVAGQVQDRGGEVMAGGALLSVDVPPVIRGAHKRVRAQKGVSAEPAEARGAGPAAQLSTP